jgi:hypothetical protein|tara:strand:+ start:2894 stop:3385 length:492 start_codon:yes stop_codon:yes gene_type:complete
MAHNEISSELFSTNATTTGSRKSKRVARHKSVPYGKPGSLSYTVEAIAEYKGCSANQILREIGYTSSSIHTGWLKRGQCPQYTSFAVEGYLARKSLVVLKDHMGVLRVASKTQQPKPEATVEIPLSTQNIVDLILVCANSGEQQLVEPLAKLLSAKNITPSNQ